MPTDRFLNYPGWVKRCAWRAAGLLNCVASRGHELWWREYIQDDGWTIDAMRSSWNDNYEFKAGAFRSGDLTIVWCNGITTQAQGERLWADYQNLENVLYAGRSFLGFTHELADELLRRYIYPVWNGGRIHFIGHSFGGTAWKRIYRTLWSRTGNQPAFEATTFGMPKFEQPDPNDQSGRTIHNRYFNTDDPVPFIPYDPGVLSATMFWSGNQGRRRLTSFAHSESGYDITVNGDIAPADNPIVAHANVPASVAAWLANAGSTVATSHSISNYEFRLRVPVASPPAPAVRPATHQLQSPVVATQQQIDRLVEPFVNTIATDSTRRNAEPVRIPDLELFSCRRSGRIWIVRLGKVEVARTMNKRRGRGLARIGNDFLRRIQRQEVVSTDDFVGQLIAYFAEASDIEGPFRPVINQGVPIPN